MISNSVPAENVPSAFDSSRLVNTQSPTENVRGVNVMPQILLQDPLRVCQLRLNKVYARGRRHPKCNMALDTLHTTETP